MKKFIALLMLLIATFMLNAQVGIPILSEGFDEEGLPAGWTTINADGDNFDWISSITKIGTGFGHNNSAGCYLSQSYDNVAGALTPDNWLVTPALNLTSIATLSFWVCAQDNSWSAEHYGVYISTTSATETSAFTLIYQETIDNTAKDQSPWVEHIIDLSAYAGDTVYIAFRHFNCTDMFYLDLDDITVSLLPDDPTIVSTPTELLFQSIIGGTSEETVSVTGLNLTSNITVSTAAPFAVSADGLSFGPSATLAQNGGSLYVQFAPTTAGLSSGEVIISADGAENDTVLLSGIGLEAATLPYTNDFENDVENAQWTVFGEGDNQWVIGTAANSTPGGSHALYVSNNNGDNNAYSDSESTTWAYRDFNFGTHSEYNISFNFRGVGENNNYDYLKVFIGDIVELPIWESNHSTPAGLTLLGTFSNQSEWTPVSFTLTSEAAGPQRLYFLWWNDDYDGYNPPAAIDDLIIAGIECGRPHSVTVNDVTAHTATFSFEPAMENDNSWEYALCTDSLTPNNVEPVAISTTTVNLTNLTPATDYHLYIKTDCSGNLNSNWSEVVDFATPPTCTTPVNLTVSQVMGTSALVSWDPAPYGATSYTLAYRVLGEESWTTIGNIVNSQVLLSGLDQLTTYEVSVTSACDEGSAPAAVEIFTTKCLAGGDLQIGEGTATSGYFPSYCYYNNSYTQQIFLANELNGASEIYSIAFDMASAGGSANSATRDLKIYLMHTSAATDSVWLNASAAQLVYSNHSTALVPGWNTFHFSAPFEYNGTDNLVVIMIDSTGNYGSTNQWRCHSTDIGLTRYIYNDNDTYSVASVPASGNTSTSHYRNNVIFGLPCDTSTTPCVAPNISLNLVSSDEITISWVAGYQETAWELQYKRENDNEWNSLGTVTTSPYTIMNLTPNTSYEIRLGTLCGDDYEWAYVSASTECVAYPIPFSENFDNYTGTSSTSATTFSRPDCWSFPITYSNTPYIISTAYNSSPNSLFFRSETATPTTAVMPALEANMETLRLKFMLKAENASYSGAFEVGVMSDPNNVNTFETVLTIQPENNAWKQYVVDMNNVSTTGTGHHIAFRQMQPSSANWYYWLDDINIIPIPTCMEPTDLASQNVTAHTVDLTWEGEGDFFNVYYKSLADADWSVVNNVSLNDNNFTLTGLTAETTYLWRVASICSNATESMSNQATFTTLVSCPAPQNFTVSNITTNSATLSWSSDANSFTVVYGETGFAEGQGITITTEENTLNLTNLTTATDYTAFLTANCGIDGSSSAINIHFSTQCISINEFPYTEGFENNGNIPTCWSQEYVTGTLDWEFQTGGNTPVPLAHSGNYNAYLFSNSDQVTRLITPVFDLTNVTNPYVSYWHTQAFWVSDQDELTVYYRTSPSSQWQQLVHYTTSFATWTFDSLALPNPSATYQIAFEGYVTFGYGITLDDVTIGNAGDSIIIIITDPTVTTEAPSAVDQTTATMNATVTNPDNLEITGHGFLWKVNGGSYQSVAGNVSGNTFSFGLSDLTPNTQYTYRAFITYNGSNIYGSDVTFTTQSGGSTDTCDVPTGLHVVENGIHNESLDVAWDAQEGVNSWNLRHRTTNGEWNTVNVTTNTHTITGLTGLTTYEIQVQAVCGEGNVSDWSSSIFEQTTNVGVANHLESCVALFPNPARDIVNVQCTMNNVQFEVTNIEVFDVYGKLITNINVIENPTTIRVSSLADGMYFVRVTTDAGAVTKTFVKQ